MATYLAHITVKPGREAAFEALAVSLHDATHAAEPGVRRYEYWRGAEPRTYYAHASFDDFLAFIDHETSDHHESSGRALMDVIERIHLEWVDPITPASPLVATAMQPLPAGATARAASYHERFGDAAQPWWLPLR